MAQHRVRNISSQRAIATDPEFKREQKMAIKAARDFQMYGEPGYDDTLIDALKATQNSTEIRTLLRKARAVA